MTKIYEAGDTVEFLTDAKDNPGDWPAGTRAKVIASDDWVTVDHPSLKGAAYVFRPSDPGMRRVRIVGAFPDSLHRIQAELDAENPTGTFRHDNEANDSLVSMLDERGGRYGKFIEHAKISQALSALMRETVGFDRLQADQCEALEMIAHKIARILNGDPNYAESWVDIAGYAKLVADRLNGVER